MLEKRDIACLGFLVPKAYPTMNEELTTKECDRKT